MSMKVIPRVMVVKRGVLLYRKIRYRKGHGVHSPFMFNFITKVIDERASYYCLNDIELTRKKVIYSEEAFRYFQEMKQHVLSNDFIKEWIRKMAIKPKSGALLMRITNYFKPKRIVQIGCRTGFSTLHLSSYASDIQTLVFEENEDMRRFCQLVFDKHKARHISLISGRYQEKLPAVLSALGSIDLVFLETHNSIETNLFAIEQCLPHLHRQSILIVSGIKTTKEKEQFWKQLCARSETGVCVDVYEFGIIFFDKKIYKRNYIVSF